MVKEYFKELVDSGKSLKGEYYISLVYNLLVRDGLKTNIFEIKKMLQWGTPYDLEIYKSKKEYIANNKKPNFQSSQITRMDKFKDETGFRLIIQNTIEIS